MKNKQMDNIEKLIKKGVKIPNPHCVEIGDEINIERISGDNVVIHSGCKIFGGSTLIMQGTKLGYEGPVTIENCQIGPQVDLKGGFFKDAVFLKSSNAGLGSHIREGTILEEESNTAHTVALKQTILFPFVTLGSLINFCDCLMSGGTSRKDHSEVGSSYIHFNYTPNQDKATPSLIGDVPRGVMLNQRPIFLGGQGGLVGPCRLEYGTVVAAGSIYRRDELRPGRLLFEQSIKDGNQPFVPGRYFNIKRITVNNIIYIANLIALEHWYNNVRSLFVSVDFPQLLFDGLKEKLNMVFDERIKRLKELCFKIQESGRNYKKTPNAKASEQVLDQHYELYSRWPELEESFNVYRSKEDNDRLRDPFLEKIFSGIQTSGKDYISVIKGLDVEDSEIGTRWLQGIVDRITADVLSIIPSFK